MEPGEALGSSPRQPAFLRCLRILERADRADVTATRGAVAGPYKRRALGARADRERERPRVAPAPFAPPREGPREKDTCSPLAAAALALLPPGPPRRRTDRSPSHLPHPRSRPRPRRTSVSASSLPRSPGPPARHNELPPRQDTRLRRHPSPLGQAGEFFCLRFPIRSSRPFPFPRIAPRRDN